MSPAETIRHFSEHLDTIAETDPDPRVRALALELDMRATAAAAALRGLSPLSESPSERAANARFVKALAEWCPEHGGGGCECDGNDRCPECGCQMVKATGCEQLIDDEMVPVEVLDCPGCHYAEVQP
jgi:hypothetical protein